MHITIKDGRHESAGDGRVKVTLTALLLCRDVIDFLGYCTGGYIISVVTGHAVIRYTCVVKITIGEINKCTGHVTNSTILIGRCGRYVTQALTGT